MPNGTRRVNADLDDEHFDYFFRHVFVGERGPRQALICTFFLKLKQQCELEGIKPVWDETNEQRVADILSRLNFASLDEHAAHNFQLGHAAGVEAQSEPRPASTRRTPRTPSKSKAQPVGPANDHGPTGRASEAPPNGSNVSPDPVQQT